MVFVLSAVAQTVTTAQFKGIAHVGGATRDISIRFSCAMDGAKINNLAIQLELPEVTNIMPTFDFDAFEGPTGMGGRHRLVASAGTAHAQMDFAATGSYGNDRSPVTTFTFSAAMTPDARTKANLQKLRAIVGTLSGGAGHLAYTISNPSYGGPSLEATVDLSDGGAAKLKSAMSDCIRP